MKLNMYFLTVSHRPLALTRVHGNMSFHIEGKNTMKNLVVSGRFAAVYQIYHKSDRRLTVTLRVESPILT